MSHDLHSEDLWGMSAERSNSRSLPPPSRRRDKPQLSCMSCRSRKLKCDRNHPCSNCSRRQQSCVYAHSGHGNQVMRDAGAPPDKAINLQERIRRLEQIVEDLAKRHDYQSQNYHEDEQGEVPDLQINDTTHEGEQAIGDESSALVKEITTEDISDSIGRMDINETETSYVGRAHWQEVVREISDVKIKLEDSSDTSGNTFDSKSTRPELLLGLSRHIHMQDILRSVPPKQTSDSLLCSFFSAMEMATLIMHRPTFEREYTKFWTNPSAVQPAWLGRLFGIFSLSTHFRIVNGNSPEPTSTLEEYRDLYLERTAQCLVLADYTKPGQYILETLLVYFMIEIMIGKVGAFRVTLLFDIVVRTAMRMGYHRDPSHYPEISVFHSEQRRRAWAVIRQMDITLSSWVGLPRLVDDRHTDTMPPRNLLDEDLDEGMIELPPSRTEETPLSYSVMKTDILLLSAKVSDEVSCINPPTYARIMELDRVLQEFRASLPLESQLSRDTMKASPIRFLRRLMLKMIYQKTRCVLHRSYVSSTREEHCYSRYSCLDAAMHIISDLSASYDESKPGKPLHPLGWTLAAGFTHDLLLAAMIVCINLEQIMKGFSDSKALSSELIEWTTEEKVHALHKAYQTLTDFCIDSGELLKGTKIIKIILEKAMRIIPQSRDPYKAYYCLEDLSQNADSHGLPAPSSLTTIDEPFSSTSSIRPSSTISPFAEHSMPDDLAQEFFAASMMDPMDFMMEVPLDISSDFWTGILPDDPSVFPDTPWNFDDNAQLNGN